VLIDGNEYVFVASLRAGRREQVNRDGLFAQSWLPTVTAGRPAVLANTMLAYLWVALGGALGSVSRYCLSGVVATRFGETFPWGTLVVNVTGSIVIGCLAALASPEGRMDSPSRTFVTQFLMIGVCGGYTTFSSFSLQTLNLIRDREWLYAGGNVLLSVALCMIAVWLGYVLGEVLTAAKGN
jgi:fluoride exporter